MTNVRTLLNGEESGITPTMLPKEFTERRDAWFRYFKRWRALHYSIGITTVFLSIAATSKLVRNDTAISILTSLAAAGAAVLTFLRPLEQGSAYISAWRILDAACDAYQFDGGN